MTALSFPAPFTVMYLDTPENRETAGDAALRYEKSERDLATKLEALLKDDTARQQWAVRARRHADELYRWDAVAMKYEAVFEDILRGKR